jgi:hypothetical protein
VIAGGLIPGGCDGVVVADSLQFTKEQLDDMTANGAHIETKSYPGTDSANACGANSRYQAVGTVFRTDISPLYFLYPQQEPGTVPLYRYVISKSFTN